VTTKGNCYAVWASNPRRNQSSV